MSPLPRRPSSSRTFFATLLLSLSSIGLLGCPGELDPRLEMTGSGGTGGAMVCDGAALMMTKCAMAGCHGATTPQAGLDLYSAGVVARLLGRPSNPAMNPACASNTNVYLEPSSTPAKGFFIDKLTVPPPCGTIMPQIPGPLSATDMACMTDWATAVTTGRITP